MRRGGSDCPSGDPGEALGCWGEHRCPGVGEAGERPSPFLSLREEKEPGPQWGGLDPGSGPRGLASSPLGNLPHSVTVHVSLALLCETRGVDWMSSEGPSRTAPL